MKKDGLNIAGIRTLLALVPCWAIRPCSDEEREKCLEKTLHMQDRSLRCQV